MSLRDRLRHNPSAKDGFQRFHHGPSEKKRQVNVDNASGELYAIGRLVAVIYLPYGSSKKNHGHYIHKFGDYGTHREANPSKFPVLASDKNGELYIIRDASPYYLNERGIVG